jgi:hypothetical protein
MAERYIVTNFAYGTGPYVRTAELAIAFNNELEKRGHARMSVIVPLVYGEKQKRIMLEEFGAHIAAHPDEILLDHELGTLLKSVFYTGERSYEETLRTWISSAEHVSNKAHAHLSGIFEVETFGGERRKVDGRDIVLEINRSPRITYNVAPSYSTTFGYIAEILEKSLSLGRDTIAVDPELFRQGIVLADSIEGTQTLNMMAYPATFSWNQEGYVPRYQGEVLVPPITNLPVPHTESMEEGIFVTITGIEGLERLYAEARALGLKLYSNDTDAVAESVKALPHVIPNPAIAAQFARAGWGSIWLSMFCGTPLVIPQFDPTDDPEIYFNNLAVEGLGIGVVYEGQPLADIIREGTQMRARSEKISADILARWGTLNGNEVCARLFADRFLTTT